MKRTVSALFAAALFAPLTQAAHILEICTLPYDGQINHLVDTNEGLIAITKLKSDKENQLGFRYSNDESSRVRYGSVTATFVVDTRDANCGFDADDVTPLKAVDYDRPWRQFQMVQDNGRDRVISADFSNTYNSNVPYLVAEGKESGDQASMPQVFELDRNQFIPVPSYFDIENNEVGPLDNGRLPPLVVGSSAMSIDSDGGNWQYRLSTVSADGALIAGNVRLKEATPTVNGALMDKDQQFAVIWEIMDAEIVFGERYDLLELENRLMITPEVTEISYHPLGRESSNYEVQPPEGLLDGIVYDSENTMAVITQIKQVQHDLYLVAGKSMSGKAMIALVAANSIGMDVQ